MIDWSTAQGSRKGWAGAQHREAEIHTCMPSLMDSFKQLGRLPQSTHACSHTGAAEDSLVGSLRP